MKFTKRLCALLMSLLMLAAAILTVFPASVLESFAISGAGAPTDFTYYDLGIDISAWQAGGGSNTSLVDFAKLKASGCKFVILRIGYGQNLDKAFVKFYNNARAAGMPLGLYIYGLSTTRSGAASDANWVISIIEKYNMYFEYPLYYDIEEQKQIKLSNSAKNALCEGWCDTLAAKGYFPGIYAGKSQICDALTASFKAKYDLWVPHVKAAAGSEWSAQYNHKSIAYNQKGFSMWQYSWSNVYNGSYVYNGVYSSGTKKVVALDLDVCYKDYPTIMKTFGYNNCGSDEKMLLKEAIDKAEDKRYDQYSSAGVTALRSAYDNAVNVYNASSSTSDNYKAARTALENAMKGATTSIISTGKAYTTSAVFNPDSDQKDDGKKLTDGLKGNSDGGTSSFVGFKGETEVVVNLGSIQNSNIYKIYMTAGSWGVAVPYGDQLSMKISTSNDGTNYTEAISANNSVRTGVKNGEWETVTLTAVLNEAISAQYIKFTINSSATNNFVWLDEVEVTNGEPLLSGNVYINGINQKIGSGDCFIFTPKFGTITVDNANHAWTANVVAKWNAEKNAYVVTSKTFGSGATTPSVTLASDEIMICANNWETGVTDGTAVVGSAANANTLYGLQEGDTIVLDGINVQSGTLSAVPYAKIATALVTEPDEEKHVHTPGPESCDAAQICLTCNEVLAEAKGHKEGEWVETESGILELYCDNCGILMDSKVKDDATDKPTEIPDDNTDDEPVKDPDKDDNSDSDYVGLRGDVNGNGEIDSMDYILLKRFYFNTFDLDDDALLRADIDENEEVDSMDYILLKRAYFNTYMIANPIIYK